MTPDPYLIVHQDKIPPLLSAGNLYAYAYCNPTNFTDPTGEIAPLIVALIIAAIVGAIVGAAGAAANGARTWDEWLVWIVGGIIGAVLTVLGFYGLRLLAGRGRCCRTRRGEGRAGGLDCDIVPWRRADSTSRPEQQYGRLGVQLDY